MAQTAELIITRQPSQRLHNAVNDIISHFGKLKDKVNHAISIGQEENWTPIQTGDLIRKELLAAGYHRNTVARVLPPEAKALPRGNNTVSNNLVQNSAIRIAKPEDYQSNQLDKYPKQFLIEIIHYLEGKAKASSPADKTNEVMALHKQGKSSREISSISGVSKTSVLRILSRNK